MKIAYEFLGDDFNIVYAMVKLACCWNTSLNFIIEFMLVFTIFSEDYCSIYDLVIVRTLRKQKNVNLLPILNQL